MSTMSETAVATQVYRIYIKASPQAIWDAITDPEWNSKYGYPGRGEYDLRPGGKYLARADEQAQAMGMPEELVDGEVLEVDPPRKLVQTWRALLEPRARRGRRLARDVRDRRGDLRRLAAHGDARARGLPAPRGAGGEHRPARAGRRRLGLDPQRPEDAARDRQVAQRLSPKHGRAETLRTGSPPRTDHPFAGGRGLGLPR